MEFLNKAAFHLLKDAIINSAQVINSGTFLQSEIGLFSRKGVAIMVSRTNFEIDEIDVYSDDCLRFILPIYLQDKTVKVGMF